MSTNRRSSRFVGVGGLGAVLLFLILGIAAVVSAPGDNLLDNPGFEDPGPANWQSKDMGSLWWSYSWSPSPVYSGDHSVDIDSNVDWYTGWWQSTPPVPITATEAYTFSGWIRTDRVANHAFLRLVFLDETGREILAKDSNAVSDTTIDWVYVHPSEPVVAPVDAVSASIKCQLWGKGKAWYDDILLSSDNDVADLEIEKHARPATVCAAGEWLTYTLRYSNTGNVAAQGVVITDTLPSSVTFAYSDPPPDGQPQPHILRWNVGSLGGGTTYTTTVIVTVSNTITDGQWLTNTATIAAENAISETARIATEVTQDPVLEIEKERSAELVSVNDTLLYTLTYRNVGCAVATGVWLTDNLPIGVTPVYSHPEANEQPDSHTLVWNVGDLEATGEDKTIIITVIVNSLASGQLLTNCAELRDDEAGASDCKVVGVNPVIYLPVVMRCFSNCTPLANGDFEDDWTGWTHGGELNQSISPDNPHSGNHSALLGDPDYNCKGGVPRGSAWMEQTFSVPCTDSPKLIFWYNIFTHDKNSKLSDTYDSFDVKNDGLRVFRDMNTTDPYGCDNLRNLGWISETIELSSYKGSCITLRFENWSRKDGWYNTWTYVDDVQVIPSDPAVLQ
jgi:uncharacterized repeat protein (TIGR01451 family)